VQPVRASVPRFKGGALAAVNRPFEPFERRGVRLDTFNLCPPRIQSCNEFGQQTIDAVVSTHLVSTIPTSPPSLPLGSPPSFHHRRFS
jgi:hypothetical protein